MEERLILTEEWDKVFPESKKVDHRKVTFHNRYGCLLYTSSLGRQRRLSDQSLVCDIPS